VDIYNKTMKTILVILLLVGLLTGVLIGGFYLFTTPEERTEIFNSNAILSVNSLYKEYWNLTSMEILLELDKGENKEQRKIEHDQKVRAIFDKAEKLSEVDQLKFMVLVTNTPMPHFKRDLK